MKQGKKWIAGLLTGVMLAGLTACGGQPSGGDEGSQPASGAAQPSGGTESSAAGGESAAQSSGQEEKLPPLKLSIMLPYGSNEHDGEEVVQRFHKDIEEYTNTEIEYVWYDHDLYPEKLTLLLTSGDLPSVVVSGKTPEFINAVENDAFWDVTDYIDDYPNLCNMSETVRLNASYNGRLYGVPRDRTLARNGVGYRLDWLDNLGLKEPETLDEFYDMLVAFTNNDPDGNGKNDTFGLAVTNYAGPWDIMQLWFGAPNKWGIDGNGDLIPDHMTEEYDNALKWFRKIYSEGLVNSDFSTYPAGDWDVMLRGGQAGCSVDVLDRFRRNQGYFEKEGIPAKTMLLGAIDAGKGLKCMPTAGYADMLAISKKQVKTEEELKRTLAFIDDLSDAAMLDLLEYGYEGISYKLDENGNAVRYTADEMKELGLPEMDWRKGHNQMLVYYQSEEEKAKRMPVPPEEDPTKLLEQALYEEDEQYCVPNYGAAYTSKTYVENGVQLDEIINQARVDYIMGVIDDVGLQAAKDQWLRSGGEDVLKEMNELYHAAGN